MQTIIRILTLGLIGAFSLLMHPGSACAIEIIDLGDESILDQAQTEPWTFSWRIGNIYTEMAQIVTAGMYGSIYKVSLYMDNVNASGPVSVSIQTVIDGEPSGIQIGSGLIPPDALPSSDNPDWVDAIIYGNVPVIPGTQFAVVVSSEGGTIRWYSSYEDVYTQGIILYNLGSGWQKWGYAGDAMFQTYVKPDELDQENFPLERCGDDTVPGEQWGQTFTAGKSGFLDRVFVDLLQTWFWTDPITTLDASIQTVTEEGYPSGYEIGHGSIPGIAIPHVYHGRVEIGIRSTQPVIAGTQYAIVLTADQGQFMWMMDDWQYYAYGGGEMIFNGGSGWTRNLPYCGAGDALFATYVAASRESRPPLSSPSPSADDDDGCVGAGGGCFIATAAYGSYWEPHVMTLRQFRDEYLLTNKLGTNLVDVYYKYSPPMADYIAEHGSLKAIVQIGLTPFIGFSWLAVNYGITAAFAVMFGIFSLLISGTFLLVKLRETT